MIDNQSNGDELSASRQAAVQQGVLLFQEIAQERDALRLEVATLKSDLAASRVVAEALQAQVTQAESKAETYRLERQQAIDDLAPYRVLFQGAVALMRAFEIEHAPLVRMTPLAEQDERWREAISWGDVGRKEDAS